MDLKAVLSHLAIAEAYDVFAPYWEESEAAFSRDALFFLDPAYLREAAAFCALSPAVTDATVAMAARVALDPALAHFAWHAYRLTFVYRDYPGTQFGKWPLLEAGLGTEGGALYIILLLAGTRMAREHDAGLGIPEAITRAGQFDVAINVGRFKRYSKGKLGALPRIMYWFRNQAYQNLYRLGRLQYVVRPFGGQVAVYRHRQSRAVLALSENAVRFDRQGLRSHPDTQPDGEACWEATLQTDDAAVVGYPILPTGYALRRQIRLSRTDWDPALARGEPVLETHIPEGGGMTAECCGDAMRQAVEFFPRYFPAAPFKAIACQSWIMNPELAEFYSPTSNLALYQRELYLYPFPWANQGGVFFIFDADAIDPKTAPRDTSIRRAMADHLARGGILRNGGMFYLPDEMPKYGTQVYRSTPLFTWLRDGCGQELGELGIGLVG